MSKQKKDWEEGYIEEELQEGLQEDYETSGEGVLDSEGSGSEEDAGMTPDGRIVLCGASAYEQKYYFNKRFSSLPDSIQKDLHIICVLFTEEVGGVLTIVFDEDGGVSLETRKDEDDIYYDEISAGLLVNEIRKNRIELLESLSLYYRMAVLHEDPGVLLKELGEE